MCVPNVKEAYAMRGIEGGSLRSGNISIASPKTLTGGGEFRASSFAQFNLSTVVTNEGPAKTLGKPFAISVPRINAIDVKQPTAETSLAPAIKETPSVPLGIFSQEFRPVPEAKVKVIVPKAEETHVTRPAVSSSINIPKSQSEPKEAKINPDSKSTAGELISILEKKSIKTNTEIPVRQPEATIMPKISSRYYADISALEEELRRRKRKEQEKLNPDLTQEELRDIALVLPDEQTNVLAEITNTQTRSEISATPKANKEAHTGLETETKETIIFELKKRQGTGDANLNKDNRREFDTDTGAQTERMNLIINAFKSALEKKNAKRVRGSDITALLPDKPTKEIISKFAEELGINFDGTWEDVRLAINKIVGLKKNEGRSLKKIVDSFPAISTSKKARHPRTLKEAARVPKRKVRFSLLNKFFGKSA